MKLRGVENDLRTVVIGSHVPAGLHAEGKALGDLLRFTPRITIPIYQRDYDWGPEHIDSLWESLTEELSNDPKQRSLFLGALVFNIEKGASGTDSDLVDGQQRISTISLLLAALRAKLDECQSLEAGKVQGRIEDMLFDRNSSAEEAWENNENDWAIRLRPSKKDRPNYAKMVAKGGTADKRTKMASAWSSLLTKIEGAVVNEIPDDMEPHTKEWTEERNGLLTSFARDVVDLLEGYTSFAVIEVSEPHNPFAVFESLNSTGLELAQSDLIKNFLLKQLPTDKKRERAVEEWNDFAKVIPKGQLVAFLRHWFIAKYKRVPRSAVYKNYRERLQTEPEIKAALEDWDRHAYWYAAFASGELREDQPEMQGVRVDPSLHSWLARYRQLGFKQGLPVLLSFIEGCDPRTKNGQAVLCKAMELLEIGYVRLFVTRQIRGSAFEAELNRICSAARSDGNTGLDTLKRIIRQLCQDHGVEDHLEWIHLTLSIERARWILYRIAEHQVGPGLFLGPPSQWHVEHVLPQTRNHKELPKLSDEDYEKLISNVGNLTLLLSSDNQALRNSPVEDKRRVYALYDGSEEGLETGTIEVVPRPNFPMNLELANAKVWDEVSIESRASKLATIASELWPIP